MFYRYLNDPETQLPHIYDHGVSEQEAEEVIAGAPIAEPSTNDSLIAVGRTRAGRLLKVVYKVDDWPPDSLFVITAYDATPKANAAFRRRENKGRGRNRKR